MKRIAKIFALAVLVLSTVAVNAQTNPKFGYIDSNKLIEMMPGRETVEKQVQAYRKELESTIQTMLNEYQTKIQEYQANVGTMSEIIKKTREKEIQDLETRIQEFQSTADYDLQQKQAQLYNPLLEKAKKAIEEVAEENGYTYIFDSSIGFLLYYEKGDNVMPLVKNKLGLE